MERKNITQIINGGANARASRDMFPHIYRELRKIAISHRRSWCNNNTINTTALIHEAYLKLGLGQKEYKNQKHFYAVAAKAMRQVLVNYAQAKGAQKRTAKLCDEDIQTLADPQAQTFDELIFIDDMLHKIEAKNPRHCKIVECRIFAGMSVEETADQLEISPSTVKREWLLVSAQLYRALKNTSACKIPKSSTARISA